MKISFQIFDLILRNFISFFRDFNGGSSRKEHLQMLVLKSKEKTMERWKRMPFNVTKTEVHHRHFYWPSPQISNSDFKEYPWKAAIALQNSMYFKNMLWNTECIDFCFQFPKYRLVRCIKLSFYYIRPTCRAVNERSYWLIEMNIKKTLLPSALGFLVLNLVEKAVLHYAGLYKSALRKKQLITSNADNLKGKSLKH